MINEPTSYNFQFKSFKLLEIHFNVNYEFLLKKDREKQVKISPEIGSGYQMVDSHICQVVLDVNLTKEEGPFSFSIKGQGDFEFQNEIKDVKEIENVVHVNLLAIMYPFIREPVADLTRRMGFTPLLLSPVNFVEMYKGISARKEPI